MAFLWLVLAMTIWGLVHSLLASLQAKAWARRLLGPGAERFYRLGYNLFSVVSLLPVAWLLLALPDRVLYSVPPPWKYLMLAGQLVALAFLAIGVLQTGIWSFLGLSQLGDSRSTPQGLVTSGLYRFVRHPLYAAGLAFLWLSPALTVDRLVIFACGTVYIVVGAFFEERKLRREFGQVYAAYAAVTPMLIPFVKGNKSST